MESTVNAEHCDTEQVTDNLLITDFETRKLNNAPITLAEAMDLTKYGKFNYIFMIISGIVLSNIVLEIGMIGFILPIMQCDLHLTNAHKGVLSSIGYIGVIASSHLWGFLADTKGRHTIIWPTLIIGYIITILSSLSNSFWLMTILRFFNGFFIAGSSATIFVYLGEFQTDKFRARTIMGSSVVFGIVLMILPIMAYFTINGDWILPIKLLGIDFKPWRLFMIVCGTPAFICGLILYFFPESPKFLLSTGNETATIQVLYKIHKWNGVEGELNISALIPEDEGNTVIKKSFRENTNIILVFLKSMWAQTYPVFQNQYLKTTLILCTIQFWLYEVVNGLFIWFPYFVHTITEFINNYPKERKTICEIVYDNQNHLYANNGTISCISKLELNTYINTFIVELLHVVFFIILGMTIHRANKRLVIFFVLATFSSCGLIAILISIPRLSLYLYVIFFVEGIGIHLLNAMAVDLYPTQIRGMATCISVMCGRLGSAVGANFIATLLSTNCELTFYISCGSLIVCALLSTQLPLTKRREKTHDLQNSNHKTTHL